MRFKRFGRDRVLCCFAAVAKRRPQCRCCDLRPFVFYDINDRAASVNADGTYSILPNVLNHEMVHVNQWEQYGDAFVEQYATDKRRWENEAYLVGP